MRNNIYYVGFNANNSILNNIFFDGSITLYPTKEKGNIYYSDTLLSDTSSDEFLKKYKMYIEKTVDNIIQQNGSCTIMCFNDKIVNLCKNLKNVKFIKNNSQNLLNFMNDKYQIRNFFKNEIPILDYKIKAFKELNYSNLKNEFGTDKLVIQGIKGSGGENTYFVSDNDDLLKISNKNTNYCISAYVKHLPLNTTLIIGKDEILQFPISAQLISTKDKTFKYVGGDFIYPMEILDELLRQKIFSYSNTIAAKVRAMGYRGILGIDFMLTENKDIKFMELNPRFQSSTFILNQYLQENYSIDMATLHYMAIENKKLPQIDMSQTIINKSFLNCNALNTFDSFENYDIITNGYFKDNKTSFYRKVFNYSLVLNNIFQHVQFKSVKENIDDVDRKKLRK